MRQIDIDASRRAIQDREDDQIEHLRVCDDLSEGVIKQSLVILQSLVLTVDLFVHVLINVLLPQRVQRIKCLLIDHKILLGCLGLLLGIVERCYSDRVIGLIIVFKRSLLKHLLDFNVIDRCLLTFGLLIIELLVKKDVSLEWEEREVLVVED